MAPFNLSTLLSSTFGKLSMIIILFRLACSCGRSAAISGQRAKDENIPINTTTNIRRLYLHRWNLLHSHRHWSLVSVDRCLCSRMNQSFVLNIQSNEVKPDHRHWSIRYYSLMNWDQVYCLIFHRLFDFSKFVQSWFQMNENLKNVLNSILS